MGDPLPSLDCSCPIWLWESDPPKWTGGNDYAVYSKVLSQPTEPGSVLNKAGTWIIDCQTSNLPQVSTQMPPFQWRSSYSTLFTMANPFPALFFSIVLIAIWHTLYFTPPGPFLWLPTAYKLQRAGTWPVLLTAPLSAPRTLPGTEETVHTFCWLNQ